MFNDFKTTVLLCAALIMGLMLAVGALGMQSLKAKNAALNAELVNAQVSVNALISSNENQAAEIARLERDNKIVSDLNNSHRKQVADLESALGRKIERAEQLRTSEHEPTKTWANADLPLDALQLLKQADCKSSDADQSGVCPTAN